MIWRSVNSSAFQSVPKPKIRLGVTLLLVFLAPVMSGQSDPAAELADRYARIARERYDAESFPDALSAAGRALRFVRDHPDASFIAAMSDTNIGVAERLNLLRSIDPGLLTLTPPAELQWAMCEALVQVKRYAEAAAKLAPLADLMSSPGQAVVLARAYSGAGLLDEAIAVLDNAIERWPLSQTLHETYCKVDGSYFAVRFLPWIESRPDLAREFAPVLVAGAIAATERSVYERARALAWDTVHGSLRTAVAFLQPGEITQQRVVELVEQGLFADRNLVLALYSRMRDISVRGRLTRHAAAFDGTSFYDANGDGWIEETTTYEHGSISAYTKDDDQDGRAEFAVEYNDGTASLVRYRIGMFTGQIAYAEYPRVGTITLEFGETGEPEWRVQWSFPASSGFMFRAAAADMAIPVVSFPDWTIPRDLEPEFFASEADHVRYDSDDGSLVLVRDSGGEWRGTMVEPGSVRDGGTFILSDRSISSFEFSISDPDSVEVSEYFQSGETAATRRRIRASGLTIETDYDTGIETWIYAEDFTVLRVADAATPLPFWMLRGLAHMGVIDG